MADNFNVGVIGCGYWGPNLIRNFFEHPQVELKYICDLDPQRLEKIGRRYPTATLVTNFQHLLADANLDAVVIATPARTHFKLAKAALEAGKHVLVEKPMCETSEECLELIRIAERHNLTLMVDHTFVYNTAVRRIKQEIDSGTLGDLLYFDSVRINLGLFQHDVNVVMDLAPHDLSILDYLVGKAPETVQASGASHANDGVEDIAYITLKFANNMIGHLHVSWLSPVKLRQILIGGTKKMIVYDDLQQTEKIRIYDKGISLGENQSDESRYKKLVSYRVGDVNIPNLDTDEALRKEADHFVNCCRTGTIPDTDGWAGYRVVRMLELANQAMRAPEAQFPAAFAVPTASVVTA